MSPTSPWPSAVPRVPAQHPPPAGVGRTPPDPGSPASAAPAPAPGRFSGPQGCSTAGKEPGRGSSPVPSLCGDRAGSSVPASHGSRTEISTIRHSSLFHLYARLGIGFKHEIGALNGGGSTGKWLIRPLHPVCRLGCPRLICRLLLPCSPLIP